MLRTAVLRYLRRRGVDSDDDTLWVVFSALMTASLVGAVAGLLLGILVGMSL